MLQAAGYLYSFKFLWRKVLSSEETTGLPHPFSEKILTRNKEIMDNPSLKFLTRRSTLQAIPFSVHLREAEAPIVPVQRHGDLRTVLIFQIEGKANFLFSRGLLAGIDVRAQVR